MVGRRSPDPPSPSPASLWLQPCSTQVPTSLAVAGGPAPEVSVPTEGGSRTGLASSAQHAGAHVSTLLAQLVPYNVIGPRCRLQQPPVNGGEVAKFLVLLHTNSPTQHGPKRRQPDVPEVGHLKDNECIAQEEPCASDHSKVGEEVSEALQAVDSEQQQVVGHLGKAREAEAPEILSSGGKHEKDLQVTLHHAAVLQSAELRHLGADIQAGAHCRHTWADR